MAILVKLSSSLRRYAPGYDPARGLSLALNGPTTATELARRLGLPLDDVSIVIINGRNQSLNASLVEGDQVAYFLPVGGG